MSIPKLEFPPFHLPPEAEALRGEVREFLKKTLPGLKTEDRFASWNTRSSEFSKALGKRGWIGITPRGAYVTEDLRVSPLAPSWLMLVLAAALAVAAWLMEGRNVRRQG